MPSKNEIFYFCEKYIRMSSLFNVFALAHEKNTVVTWVGIHNTNITTAKV